MANIRVLVVDDSVVIRRVLVDMLGQERDIEVTRTASNGRIALARIEEDTPDLVILDVEMPVMDGLQTLAEIRKIRPRLPVIMFSARTEQGASATLDALSLGASDCMTKPSSMGGGGGAFDQLCAEMAAKIRGLCGGGEAGVRHLPPARSSRSVSRLPPSETRPPVGVLVIGVSTGGPNALAEFLPAIPGDFPVPILVVQHMPVMFTAMLAERLDRDCAMPVSEGMPGVVVEPGQIWLAPGDRHMVLERDGGCCRLGLNQEPPENSCRPAVDVLFRSAAASFGSATLAVVLTGMGRDGLRGCEVIAEAGGRILVQDEASSVVWGMPGFVARAGLAEKVLPLTEIASAVCRTVQSRDRGAAT